MNILDRRRTNSSLFFVGTAFKRPYASATRLALGACAALIGLLSPATVAAQSRWSGIATIGYIQGINNFASDRSGLAGSVAAYFGISPSISLGLNLEYYGLGWCTISHHDPYDPANTWQSDTHLNMLEADLSCRIRKASGSIRPYTTVGGGISISYWQERFVDSPQTLSWSEVQPLVVLGVGADFPHVLGALGVGIQGRWRMIPTYVDESGITLAHFLTISIGISLN